MVRNTQGGSKTKSMARKSTTQTVVNDYKPTDPLERVAIVEKMYGNGMCQVITVDSERLDLMCHIRGKFKGRMKKHNMITVKSRIVIGLREWESPYKNADLISVLTTYEETEGGHENNTNDSFVFSTEEATDYSNFIMPSNNKKDVMEHDDEINIDDI
jgi:hypothetical protein